MPTYLNTYQQYSSERATFLKMVTARGEAASLVNSIPVFNTDLSPAAIKQFATVQALDSQLKKMEAAIGRSTGGGGNYAIL
jgi:hypothetical protein